jgi:hypothetical protein
MKIKLDLNIECRIEVNYFTPYERYIEFDAFIVVGDKEIEFDVDLYSVVYDEVYDYQYQIWENDSIEHKTEKYLLNKVGR